MRNAARRSFQSRSAHRSGVKAPVALLSPLFVPIFLRALPCTLGYPASDPGGARCAATSKSRREGCGRSRLPANQSTTMDNKPSFAERVTLLRETAYKLREAAETVLAEVQHMEAAAKRFNERSERRSSRRNTPASSR